MTLIVRVFVLVAALIGALPSAGGERATADSYRALEEVFGEGVDTRPVAPEPRWRPGHESVVWIDATSSSGPTMMEFDPITGARQALVSAAGWSAAWADRGTEAPALADPVWRPDGMAFVLNHGDEMALFDLVSGVPRILDTGPGPEEHARFAPDGRRIAWVRKNDLWVYDFASDREIRLTDDGSETVFNGVFDWVYQEELADRAGRAFAWSDDGAGLVWLRLDDGEIPVFHLIELTETHSRVIEQRYPKPGDPSPRPSLHAIRFDDDSGVASRTSLRFDDPQPYIPRFGFTENGGLWYQLLNREQDELRLVRADLKGSGESTVVSESSPHWVEPVDGLRFLRDGAVLWLSRRSGHTHLLRIAADGSQVDLTPGEWDVTRLVGVDAAERFAWYQAARPDPMVRRLYRVDLATGDTSDLTPTGGTHAAELGSPPTGKLLLQRSSLAAPPRWKVLNGGGGGGAEVPVEHPIPRIDYADHRFVEVPDGNGGVLNAMLLLPPGFDERRTYPVVIYVYGGPHAQTVLDSWPGTLGLFNHTLAGRGFVVFSLDNRGSAARGRVFETAVDLALGSTQLPDQLAGVAWLHRQPWVDSDRIGIWGWSYGGYMTAYALTRAPGVFAAGAAVAPVTDWRLYDSVYTERYMGTPLSNPAGYASASVLDEVGALDDPLLVIHGTGDDNVHVQHTIQLADRAWRSGVRFDLMLFPGLAHGINANGSHLALFTAVTDFFEEHLGSSVDRLDQE